MLEANNYYCACFLTITSVYIQGMDTWLGAHLRLVLCVLYSMMVFMGSDITLVMVSLCMCVCVCVCSLILRLLVTEI